MEISVGTNKLKINVAKEQYRKLKIYLGMIVLTLIIGGFYYENNYESQNFIGWAVIGIVLILILIILDELGIVELRSTPERMTKCAVCSRTYESSKHDEDGRIVKTTIESGDTDKKIEEITHDYKKARPLEGLIINGKVVCTDCIKKIREWK